MRSSPSTGVKAEALAIAQNINTRLEPIVLALLGIGYAIKFSDGVSFTGSTAAGSIIAAEAGKNIKKLVMELGGSDPYIVLDSSNIDEAVKNSVYARLQNNGQSCIASK